MFPQEARRMVESAARWRILAWVVTVLGAIGVFLIAYFGARDTGWYRETRFNTGAFIFTLGIYGVFLVVGVSPLFLTGRLMTAVSQVQGGAHEPSWARAKAGNWRIVTWVLSVVGVIFAMLLAVGVANVGEYLDRSDGSYGTAAFVVFLVFVVVWMLEIWPLFMLCRVLEGMGVLLGEGSVASASTAAAWSAPGPSRPGPTLPGAPWEPTHRAPTEGLSIRRRPDPAFAEIRPIAGGVEVRVQMREGDWALVETEQGARGWADGRRLEPLAPPPPGAPLEAPPDPPQPE
jgi:hypothetical protein